VGPFYWEGLRPNPEGRPNPPTGPVAALIDRDFGSAAAFQEQFTAQAVGHFGSGWVWLVQGPDGKLRITQGHAPRPAPLFAYIPIGPAPFPDANPC